MSVDPVATSAPPGLSQVQEPRSLMELPQACMMHIIKFLDTSGRQQFFRTAKSCAAALLTGSGGSGAYHFCSTSDAASTLLQHWASNNGHNMVLSINCNHLELHAVLGKVLQYQGGPASYPGIHSLELLDLRCSTPLIPGLLSAAFPNLTTLKLYDWDVELQPEQVDAELVQPTCVPKLSHVTMMLSRHGDYKQPSHSFVITHISQQLSQMQLLVSLGLNDYCLPFVPVGVLGQLTHLFLDVAAAPEHGTLTALKACTSLQALKLRSVYGTADYPVWVAALPGHVVQLRSVDMNVRLTQQLIEHLLRLPNLTSLTVGGIHDDIAPDVAATPCAWREVHFLGTCSEQICQLPLHTLDQPVTCRHFFLGYTADHAADLSAIRLAKPHLLRCGGIKPLVPTLHFGSYTSPGLTCEQALELLRQWAPCLPAPERVCTFGSCSDVLTQAQLSDVWPGAHLER